jgi:acetyltransferase-like isoleucine patch superfamily enzyme
MRVRFLAKMISIPLKIPGYVRRKFFVWRMSIKANIDVRGKIILDGIPIIDISKGARLEISNNVSLGSTNRGHHINIYAPVKLFADRDGACIRIGENTRLSATCIHAYELVSIGRNCLIAANCQIMDNSGHDLSFDNVENRINTGGSTKPVAIEDNVWIGANSIILPGVKIGAGSVISAGSVVSRNIPPMVIAMGNPAVVVGLARFFLRSSNL